MKKLTLFSTSAALLLLATPNMLEAQDKGQDDRDVANSATTNTSSVGPAEQFGEKTTLAISSDAAFTIQRTSTSGVSGGTTTISLAPAADYFVGKELSLGGFLGFEYTKAGNNHGLRFAIGPRVGYNFPLSDLVSIWPRAGVSLAATDATTSTPLGKTSKSDTTFALNLFVPIMFHPATHFFVGFGPFLDADLSGDTRTTIFGGRLTVGGWLRP
ncbi:MAG TPA: hypothetical protein VHM19_02950 [Polyangiales bacterium]|jgi:hypothetical protein|nr:hypothetical protein [Polyangiales bacterium]